MRDIFAIIYRLRALSTELKEAISSTAGPDISRQAVLGLIEEQLHDLDVLSREHCTYTYELSDHRRVNEVIRASIVRGRDVYPRLNFRIEGHVNPYFLDLKILFQRELFTEVLMLSFQDAASRGARAVTLVIDSDIRQLIVSVVDDGCVITEAIWPYMRLGDGARIIYNNILRLRGTVFYKNASPMVHGLHLIFPRS